MDERTKLLDSVLDNAPGPSGSPGMAGGHPVVKISVDVVFCLGKYTCFLAQFKRLSSLCAHYNVSAENKKKTCHFAIITPLYIVEFNP